MIDREDVAWSEKRGEWRDRDGGGLGGEGLPPRAGSPSGRETKGATPEGGVSLGAEDEGGERQSSPYLSFPFSFYPSPRELRQPNNYPLRALGKSVFALSR